MKTNTILVMVSIAVITGIGIYGVSPYFTNTTIDEDLPDNIATTKDAGIIDSVVMKKEDTVMMEESIPMFYGDFVGVNDGIHNAEGKALVVPLDDGSSILRLEDFESTNGPDLYVYLSTDKKASDFINLGKLKANSGNQNYEIPHDTDLRTYNNVLIWCKTFGVLFGNAELEK